MANQKVTNLKLAFQPGTSQGVVEARWSFSTSNTDHYELHWWYGIASKAGGTVKWYPGDFTTVNGSIKVALYSYPSEAWYVKVKVKPVSKTHKVKVNGKEKDESYWTGSYVTSNPFKVKTVTEQPEAVTGSYEIIAANEMYMTASTSDANATHILFQVNRPEQPSIGNIPAGTGNQLVKIPANRTASATHGFMYLGYGYRFRVQAYNANAKVYGPVSVWYPEDQSLIATPPGTAPANIKAWMLTDAQGNQSSNVLTIQWDPVPGATIYEVNYTTYGGGWSNPDLYTKIDTETSRCRLDVANIEIGKSYWIRVRGINEDAEWDEMSQPNREGAGPWPESSIYVTLGKAPAQPTTWSNKLVVETGGDVKFYWTHNTTDGSPLNQSRLTYETDVSSATSVLVDATFDTETGTYSSHGEYTLSTSDPKFADATYIKWWVETKGVSDDWSPKSTVREVALYAKPQLSVSVSATKTDTGNRLETVSSYPFYILANAPSKSQKVIGYTISITPDTSYETTRPDGTVGWVNAGHPVYLENFDIDSSMSSLAFGDYAEIVDNQIWVRLTPAMVALDDTPGVNYTVKAVATTDKGLSATAEATFDVLWADDEFVPDADLTVDEEALVISILPECYTDANLTAVSSDVSLAVYRYSPNGEFTLIGDGIQSGSGQSVTDPHPGLRSAVYRIVATSNRTGQMHYTDLDPVDIGETGLVIQWNESWRGLIVNTGYDSNGYVEYMDNEAEGPWSGSMVIIPANIKVSNSASPDAELVKYDGRAYPVAYYGTQLNESGTWTAVYPKSEINVTNALRRLQRYAGDVYVREPSGLGYWANVKVEFPINYVELVVEVTLTITRVEGGI